MYIAIGFERRLTVVKRSTRDSRYSKSCWQLSIVWESNRSSMRINGSVTSVSSIMTFELDPFVSIGVQGSPNSVSTNARSSRLQNDENLVSDCCSIYTFGKPRTEGLAWGVEGACIQLYHIVTLSQRTQGGLGSCRKDTGREGCGSCRQSGPW